MKRILTLTTLLAVLAACGSEHTSSTSSVATAPSIAGTFKSSCLSIGSGWYSIMTLTNTDTSSIQTSDQYFDSTCTTLRITDKFTRTYTTGNAVASGGYEINITFQKVERTYLVQTTADGANSDHGFGFTNWIVGVAKETSGLQYSSAYSVQPKAGQIAYLIYKADATTYAGGDTTTGDGTTAAKRPTALTSIVLKKQ